MHLNMGRVKGLMSLKDAKCNEGKGFMCAKVLVMVSQWPLNMGKEHKFDSLLIFDSSNTVRVEARECFLEEGFLVLC